MRTNAFMTFRKNCDTGFSFSGPDALDEVWSVTDKLFTNANDDQFYIHWDPCIGFMATLDINDSMSVSEIESCLADFKIHNYDLDKYEYDFGNFHKEESTQEH